ncbi:hypothetical protein BU15DRAFT_67684 [Melanogaster broomeanus]|nr:hypothetical protein BU15DRAFT_67684 [Melanogaster broomeanus]
MSYASTSTDDQPALMMADAIARGSDGVKAPTVGVATRCTVNSTALKSMMRIVAMHMVQDVKMILRLLRGAAGALPWLFIPDLCSGRPIPPTRYEPITKEGPGRVARVNRGRGHHTPSPRTGPWGAGHIPQAPDSLPGRPVTTSSSWRRGVQRSTRHRKRGGVWQDPEDAGNISVDPPPGHEDRELRPERQAPRDPDSLRDEQHSDMGRRPVMDDEYWGKREVRGAW